MSKPLSRQRALLEQASEAGLLSGDKAVRVSCRVTGSLMEAAAQRSGIQSRTALIEYALSKVALEDDYGDRLLALKGSVPADVEL
jgi:4-hydroxy-3-methylbut-2-en-1-yl diphosphate synthase IspG/GcpE